MEPIKIHVADVCENADELLAVEYRRTSLDVFRHFGEFIAAPRRFFKPSLDFNPLAERIVAAFNEEKGLRSFALTVLELKVIYDDFAAAVEFSQEKIRFLNEILPELIVFANGQILNAKILGAGSEREAAQIKLDIMGLIFEFYDKLKASLAVAHIFLDPRPVPGSGIN